jgi:hypothetical protein
MQRLILFVQAILVHCLEPTTFLRPFEFTVVAAFTPKQTACGLCNTIESFKTLMYSHHLQQISLLVSQQTFARHPTRTCQKGSPRE